MSIAADGVPVKIVLATQIAEAQIVVRPAPDQEHRRPQGPENRHVAAGQRHPCHRQFGTRRQLRPESDRLQRRSRK